MPYEMQKDERGERMVLDKIFDVQLKKTLSGMGKHADIYTFSCANKSVEFSVEFARSGVFHVKNITDLLGVSPEVFKECFNYYFEYSSKKANTPLKVMYSFS